MADSKALRVALKLLISIPILVFAGAMEGTLGQMGNKMPIMLVGFVVIGALWGVWGYKPKSSKSRDLTRK